MTEAEIIKYYDANYVKYGKFLKRLQEMIKNILEIQGINFNVETRVKQKNSFVTKALEKQYVDLKTQFTDFAGLRIVVNDIAQVKKVCEIIENEFLIDKKNSGDKLDGLDENKVGYLSVHFITSFTEEHLKIRENSPYKDLKVEIQVRTILQHAWAQMTHDKIYKYRGNISKKLLRQVNLLAGLLEIADNEFVRLEKEVSLLSCETNETSTQNINELTLLNYMHNKFDFMNYAYFKNVDDILIELKEYGIITLDDFENLISEKILNIIKKYGRSFCLDGIVHQILIMNDPEKFYSLKSSKKKISKRYKEIYEEYGLDMNYICKKYNLEII